MPLSRPTPAAAHAAPAVFQAEPSAGAAVRQQLLPLALCAPLLALKPIATIPMLLLAALLSALHLWRFRFLMTERRLMVRPTLLARSRSVPLAWICRAEACDWRGRPTPGRPQAGTVRLVLLDGEVLTVSGVSHPQRVVDAVLLFRQRALAAEDRRRLR